MAEHNDLGKWGEDLAENYLANKGYAILHRDWRLGKRDIDIIALTEDNTTIVFVEVKTRKWDDKIDPVEAVNRQKMKSIGIAANAYIKAFNIEYEWRFDIITIVGNGNNINDVRLTHIEDAFNPCLL